MNCDICGKMIGHDYRCPNYVPKNGLRCCSYCNKEILDGDEYIENPDGEYRHYDCFHGIKELLEWLGHEILTMEDTYERFN